jgi:hypothetical protein
MTDQDWRKHVWRPCERAEALERLAARIEQNADATDLAPRRQPPAEPAIVTKAAPPRAAAAATSGNEWVRWRRGEVPREATRSSRAMTNAVAKVVIDEERARQGADGEIMAAIAELKAEVERLQARIAEIETAKGSAPAARGMPSSIVSPVG